jgi:Domain of unknown function (DUF1990)
MPRRPTRTTRIVTAAFWPVGIGLTSWNYMWRTTPFHRRDLPGSIAADWAPALPADVALDEVQRPEDGVGPLFHRRFHARFRKAGGSPEELMALVTADLNRLTPTGFAHFSKVRGDKDRMRMGDEYVVRMPGPWDGPVRVVARTPTSFRLATLTGHLEAGQIEFRASKNDDDLCLSIETWASSGDRLSRLLYQHLRMAKEVQFHMWTSFLERAARLSGGRLTGGIDVETRQVYQPGQGIRSTEQ